MMTKTLAPIAVMLLMTTSGAARAHAQTQNTGNPEILQTVQEIRQTLNAVATEVGTINSQGASVPGRLTTIADHLASIDTQLAALTSIVDALTTAPPSLSTAFTFKPSGYSASCRALNAGTSTAIVTLELMKIDGTVQQNMPNLVLGPGQGNGFSLAIGSLPNHFWCRFSMVSGSSADIRANLVVLDEGTGLADAILPAR